MIRYCSVRLATLTLLLGIGQVIAAVEFFRRRDEVSARWLLRASLLYLTCWMGVLVMVAV